MPYVRTSFASGGLTYALTQLGYDAANNLVCTAVRMNRSAFNSLPASACALGVAGADGPDLISFNRYDAAGELTGVTTGYGTASQADYATATYSPNGLVTTVKDAQDNLTTTVYDGFDRVSKVRFPLPAQGSNASSTTDYESFTYDPNGNLLTARRRSGETIGFTYDALNRLTLKNFPPATQPDVYYAYDLLNRSLYAHFGSAGGAGVDNAWDALGRLTSTTASGRTLSYQYDLAGDRTRVTWPDAAPNSLYVGYAYDLLGRVTQVQENGATSGLGLLATYSYDDLGRATKIARGSGGTSPTLVNYDGADRLNALTQSFRGSADDVTFNFSWSPASQISSKAATNDAFSFHPNPLARGYVANGLNQYTKTGGVTPTYDARGNLISDSVGSYGYDLENHLLTASAPTAVTLAYDPLGRPQNSTAAGATTTFLYDGDDLVAEYDASGNILRRHVFGPGVDEPLVWYQGPGTSDRRWLRADDAGSIIGWSDSAGALIAARGYDPFGQPSGWLGSRFGYTGQAMIPEARLYHYKARAYDPALGRFLQTDPIGMAADVNLYAYVGNDPINARDPSGTAGLGLDIAAIILYNCEDCSLSGGDSSSSGTGDYGAYGCSYDGGCSALTGGGVTVTGQGRQSYSPIPTFDFGAGGGGHLTGGRGGAGTGPQKMQQNRQTKQPQNTCPFGMSPAAAGLAVGASASTYILAPLHLFAGAELLGALRAGAAGAELGGEIGAVATSETGPGLLIGGAVGLGVGFISGAAVYYAENKSGCKAGS
ncbi:MAG: RHS repeat-associated core domain-containing protein [Caulobacteraceae bacterium]|nr:RHS repeat-associated core domain-containing protein [Caulobacteraceae bacterium]